jgi:hypothetical protein
LKETDKAWFAGIIDGEGCISLFKRSTYYVPAVKIANTNEKLINKCKEILNEAGIEYYIRYSDRGERKNAKPAWEIALESRPRVVATLELILPYLVSKKEQAELVLEWCSEKIRRPEDSRTDFIDKIRSLNRRGRECFQSK